MVKHRLPTLEIQPKKEGKKEGRKMGVLGNCALFLSYGVREQKLVKLESFDVLEIYCKFAVDFE